MWLSMKTISLQLPTEKHESFFRFVFDSKNFEKYGITTNPKTPGTTVLGTAQVEELVNGFEKA